MDVCACINTAEKNKDYLTWKNIHPHAFLSYFFLSEDFGQVGFYDEKIDKVFSLKLDATMNVVSSWEDEVFCDPEKKIEPLVLDSVTLSVTAIKEAATLFFSEKYKTLQLVKMLYLLEKMPGFGVVWNITFVTTSFLLIIIKLDPRTGKLLDEQKTNLVK